MSDLREAAEDAVEAWDRVTSIEYRDIAKGTLADPMIRLRAALSGVPEGAASLTPGAVAEWMIDHQYADDESRQDIITALSHLSGVPEGDWRDGYKDGKLPGPGVPEGAASEDVTIDTTALWEAFEAGWLARDRQGPHVGSPRGYAGVPVDYREDHDVGCCARRGCHAVCSHLCGTDLHTCDGTVHAKEGMK